MLRQRVPATPDEAEVEVEMRGGATITDVDLQAFMAEHNAKGVGLGMNQRSRDDFIYGGEHRASKLHAPPQNLNTPPTHY